MSSKDDKKKNSVKELINFDDVKKAAIVLKALNNPIRKKLINYLLKNEPTTVSNLVFNLRVEQTIISQHLNILRKAKIVTFLKKGKNVYYFLNKTRIEEIQKSLEGIFDEITESDLKKIERI
ncbi:MAG: metalloregulator ArsR/SmtB family transcription factor [Thermoproteota archaeon]|nr:metalloregulator ArsR/SmtB family transcription factor [Thermoproteota archaeon]